MLMSKTLLLLLLGIVFVSCCCVQHGNIFVTSAETPIISQAIGLTTLNPIFNVDASETRVQQVTGSCVDPRNGDVYILDSPGKKILKIDAKTNKVSWYAGNGVQATCYPKICSSGDRFSVGFQANYCIVDPSNGDLYFSDTYNNYVRKIDAITGYTTVVTGNGAYGYDNYNNIPANSSSVGLGNPTYLVVDSKYVYIADSGNSCIRKVDKVTKMIFTHAGNCGTSGDNADESAPIDVSNALFNYIYGMVLDPKDGSIFVTDSYNSVIRQIFANGTVTRVSGVYGFYCANFDSTHVSTLVHCDPGALAIDNEGNIIVQEMSGYVIRVINRISGNVSTIVGKNSANRVASVGITGDGQLGTEVTVSDVPSMYYFNGSLYWIEGSLILRKMDPSGIVKTIIGTLETTDFGLPLKNANLGTSSPIRFNSNGNMYLMGSNMLVVVKDGLIQRVSGGTGIEGSLNNINPLYMQLTSTSPADFIIDQSNNDIYIAEPSCVKKIDALAWKIFKYAGGGLNTIDNVLATNASLSGVKSITLSLEGHLLIAESYRIYLVDKNTKLITTIAGNGTSCSSTECGDNGLAISATFGGISSIHTDSKGDLYISDKGRSVIRVIRKNTSVIELFAGNYTSNCPYTSCGEGGSAIGALLYQPSDIAVHPLTGEIYIADRNRIRKVSNGTISTVVGVVGSTGYDSFKRGEWSDALSTGITPSRISFSPTGQLYFDDGNLNNILSLRTLKSDNTIETVSGHFLRSSYSYNGENLSSKNVKLSAPTSSFVTENGDIYIGCSGSNAFSIGSTTLNYARIAKYSASTKTTSTMIGNLVTSTEVLPSENSLPKQVTLTPTTTDNTFIGGTYIPFGIFVLNNDIYFTDSGRHIIRLYNSTTGLVNTIVGTKNIACASSRNSCGDNGIPLNATLNTPSSIFVTNNGTIYFSDMKNHRIRKVSNGIITTIAGSGIACAVAGQASCDSSDPLQVSLRSPTGIFVSRNGSVYFTDTGNHKVRMLSADGKNMTIIAGSSSYCSSGSTVNSPCATISNSSTDSTAKLYYPTGVTVDEETGDVYIADSSTLTIRKVYANGTMVIYAGSFPGVSFTSSSHYRPEGEVATQLHRPSSLFLNKYGLFVTEPYTARVLKLNPPCPTGYTGFRCDLITCDGVLQNDAQVCSGKGSCVGPNQCTCNAGYEGAYCDSIVTCFNVLHSNASVCSGRGNCSLRDTCICNRGYYGPSCNISDCNGVLSNQTNVCSSRGSCVGYNNCSCVENYFGTNCNITKCNGTDSNAAGVCSNQGSCIAYNTCQCDSQHHGMNCENTWCFGVPSNSSNVCSSQGKCTSYNTCQCNLNYYNENCNAYKCDGLFSNDTNVCHNFGQCVSPNNCQCDSQHFGQFCELTTCMGILSNSSSVCSSHGYCSSFNNCTCAEGYWGSECSNVKCNGTLSNDTSVCNGRGQCVGLNNCTCQTGYIGQYCENIVTVVSNNTILNQTNTVNVTTNSTSTVNVTTSTTTTTNSTSTCFGISSLQSKLVCSGNGKCTGKDKCECSNGFYGKQCEILSCNGIMSNSSNVCSGHGKCASLNTCTCQSGYGGLNCDTITCFGILATSENVCKGRGICTAIDSCQCFTSKTNYKINGIECENLMCKGNNDQFYLQSDSRACNNRGVCSFNRQNMTGGCQCLDGYSGDKCESFKCFGVSSTNSQVCSGKGQCTDKNTCSCYNSDVLGHYSGFNCSSCSPSYNGTNCLSKICDDYYTCSNHGSCNANLDCVCTGNWNGKLCDTCKQNYYGSNCTNYCTSEITCCSHGVCGNNGSCSCHSNQKYGFWKGDSCNQCQDSYYGKDCTTNFGANNSVTINDQTDGIVFKLYSSYDKYNVDCKKLIHSSELSLYGTQPKCYWTNKENGDFKIEFDVDFTLSLNANPTIRLNRLVFDSTDTDYQVMQVSLSPNVKSPIAKLQTQKTSFSICEDLKIDGSKSYSGDKKSLQFKWDITGTQIPLSVSNSVKSNSASLLQIAKGSLTSGVYTIQLSVVSSFSGKQSASESIVLTISDVPIPTVSIIGKKEVSLLTTQRNVIIKKSISIPSCFYNDTSLSIDWELVSGPALNFKKDSYNNLVISSFTTLGVQQYIMKVTATSTVNSLSTSSDYLIITTTQPSLELALKLKSATSLQNELEITLNDPENNLNENQVWMWTCVDPDTNGYCGDNVITKLTSNANEKSTSVVLTPTDFSFITRAQLSLTVYKGDRSVTDTINLNLNNPPPIVNTVSVSPQSITSKTKAVGLQYQIVSEESASARLTSNWTLNGDEISSSLVKKKDSSSILIDSSLLEEGSQSLIELTVSYVNKSSQSVISSTTKSTLYTKSRKPKKCPCSISPSLGYALETDFSYSCQNCQNEENSIEVQVGFINAIGQKIPLSKGDEKLSTKIPAGSSNIVEIYFDIVDTLTSEKTTVSTNVTILTPSIHSMDDLISKATSFDVDISSLVKDGDSNKVLFVTSSSILTTSQMFKSINARAIQATYQELKEKQLDNLILAYGTTNHIVTDSQVSLTLNGLNTLLGDYCNQVIFDKSVSLIGDLIFDSIRYVESVEGFSPAFKGIIENLLKYAKDNGMTSDIVIQLLKLHEYSGTLLIKNDEISNDPLLLSNTYSNIQVDRLYNKDLNSLSVNIATKQQTTVSVVFPTISIADGTNYQPIVYSIITNVDFTSLNNSMKNYSMISPNIVSLNVYNSPSIDQNTKVTIQIPSSTQSDQVSCLAVQQQMKIDETTCKLVSYQQGIANCQCQFSNSQSVNNVILVTKRSVSVVNTPTTPTTPTTPNTPVSSSTKQQGLSNSDMIIVIVVCVVGGTLIILVTAVVLIVTIYFLLRRKRTKVRNDDGMTKELYESSNPNTLENQ